jgi:membrane associated rhomboid family serine protease
VNDPPATNLLIAAICLVSFLALNNPVLEEKYIFRPEDILARKQYYRLVTCGFLHGGWAHLLMNVYTLYVFGGVVERLFGSVNFLLIYFASLVGGSLLSLYLHRHHDYAAYGASGGVCGLIFAYVLWRPQSRMAVFPIPYAVPGWLYAIAFMTASFYALKSAKDNIGHDAHLGGAVIGLVTAAGLKPELAQEHWIALVAMLLVAGLFFGYLYANPMFLPLAAFSGRPSRRSWARHTPITRSVAPAATRRLPKAVVEPPTDWLIQQLEIQVGKLEGDPTGAHQWIDKFGRTYDLLSCRADQFEFTAFTTAVKDRLGTSVDFVVVDTRELNDVQVAHLRPFFADLPDPEFNRVIRSFALKS